MSAALQSSSRSPERSEMDFGTAHSKSLDRHGRQAIVSWGKLASLIRRRLAWVTMGSFWAEAYQSFRKTGGFVAGIISMIAGLWAITWPTPFSVDVRWFGLVAIFCYVVTATASDLAGRALAQVILKPKMVGGGRTADGFQFLLAPNRAFSHDSVVSIFNLEGELEVGIGWGRVVTIQDGGRLQVLVYDTYGQDELWERICRPDKVLMATLIVKTTVPFSAIQRIAPGSST